MTPSTPTSHERAINIHRRLTGLVLEATSPTGKLARYQELADALSKEINQSISIETESFEVLGFANIVGVVDRARIESMEGGRTPQPLLDELKRLGILDDIQRNKEVVRLPKLERVGLTLPRLLAPIVVQGEILGYFWLIASQEGQELTDLDYLAIESGATVAALMRLQEKIAEESQERARGTLLQQLLDGHKEHLSVLNDRLKPDRVDLEQPFHLLILKAGGALSPTDLRRKIARASLNWQAFISEMGADVVVLVAATDRFEMQLRALHHAVPGLQVFVSPKMTKAERARTAYDMANRTMQIAGLAEWPEPTVHYADLSYLHTLYLAGREALDLNPFVAVIEKLRHEMQPDVEKTLEVYLDFGGNGVQTAQKLDIHRSTLNYRLQRIEEVCGVNLGDSHTRTNLQVAIKLMRLFPKDEPSAL